jgi:hypothetical protein
MFARLINGIGQKLSILNMGAIGNDITLCFYFTDFCRNINRVFRRLLNNFYILWVALFWGCYV